MKLKCRNWLLVFPVVIAWFAISCSDKSDDTPEEKGLPEVVATSTMVADMVRTIAGDDLKVIAMMAPGVDPHTYEPPARVYSDLRLADAIIYNGLHLEGKMTESFESQGDKTLALTDNLPSDRLISPENIDEKYGDPHIWGDASLWALSIPTVVAKLSEINPEMKAEFEARGAAYQKEVTALNEWIISRINEIPEANRILITSHDAFSYFGKAYGVQVIGVQGISTVDEPSGADILNTIDLIKDKGVKAIFPESSVSPAVIQRISKDSKVTVGETLFSDSCGPLGEMESRNGETYDLGTYIGMMKHNVNAMVAALK
ncbi:MAG: zinc ABC transporter substrate-binding protein [Verrucomicrobiales bacterium]|nr:zinc ABC transporter substrate-binding protein [Verrucomicrobiales bacterium]